MENVETLRTALTAENWRAVNRRLLRKVIAEFAYEEIIVPTAVDQVGADDSEVGESWSRFRLRLGDGVEYQFDAQRRPLDSYRVREGSVHRRIDPATEQEVGDGTSE